MQLAKNLYQLAGPFYGNSSSVYGVTGEKDLVLIDAGYDKAQLNMIEKNIKYWGLDKYRLSHVLITHCHFDHCGNAAELRAAGAKLVSSKVDAEAIESGDDRTIGFAFMGKKFPAVPVDIQMDKDGEIEIDGMKFKFIFTPGHTAGSCCISTVLADGKTALFTGDTIHVGMNCGYARLGWNGSVDFNGKDYFNSIVKLKDMQVDMVLAGHEYNCLENGSSILQDAYKQALLSLRDLPYNYVSSAMRNNIPIF